MLHTQDYPYSECGLNTGFLQGRTLQATPGLIAERLALRLGSLTGPEILILQTFLELSPEELSTDVFENLVSADQIRDLETIEYPTLCAYTEVKLRKRVLEKLRNDTSTMELLAKCRERHADRFVLRAPARVSINFGTLRQQSPFAA